MLRAVSPRLWTFRGTCGLRDTADRSRGWLKGPFKMPQTLPLPSSSAHSSSGLKSRSFVKPANGTHLSNSAKDARSLTGSSREKAPALCDALPKDEQNTERPKRFAVLVTGHGSDFTERKYGGYGQMFVDLLKDPGEAWDTFMVLEGQFPLEEELNKYDGFVLTGSRHDAHSDEDWILRLVKLLQTLHQSRQKMLGICFGHQVLSRALGGKTGRAEVGWEMGLREIAVTSSLKDKSYAAGLPQVFRILESHRDQVSEVPPGGELGGSSTLTPVEVFTIGEHVLCMQGHPEFTHEVLEDLVADRLTKGAISAEVASSARSSMEKAAPDSGLLQSLCKRFLKGTSAGSTAVA